MDYDYDIYMIRDITERKKRRKTTATSDHLMRSISSIDIFSTEHDHHTQKVSPVYLSNENALLS